MADEKDAVMKLLDGSKIPTPVKAQVWQDYFSAEGPEDFIKRMDKLNIPTESKRDLWNVKYTQPSQDNTPAAKPDSVLGGFGRRAKQTFTGLLDTFTEPPRDEGEKKFVNMGLAHDLVLPFRRIGQGFVEGEKEAGKQVKEQASKGNVAGAGVTGISMLDPFATGTVTDVNKLEEEGRNKEAIGTAAFDILLLGLGSRLGRKPTDAAKLNKLTYAAGGEREALRQVMPELEKTAQVLGKPKTVGGLLEHVDQTLTSLNNEFNTSLQPIRGRQIMPSNVAQKLLDRANRANLRMTAVGRAERTALRKAALDFQRPWTMEQLNEERMSRYNARMEAKSSVGQANAMKSSVDAAIDKIVEDELRDLVYSEMNSAYPGKDFGALKQKQSSLMTLKDQLTSQVKKIADAQGREEGKPFMARESITAYAHPEKGNVGTRIHGLQKLLPGSGPEQAANRAVVQAGGPSRAASVRRATVLTMPIIALDPKNQARKKDKQDKKDLTPLQ